MLLLQDIGSRTKSRTPAAHPFDLSCPVVDLCTVT